MNPNNLLPVPVLAERRYQSNQPARELALDVGFREARESTKPPVVQNGTLAAGNNTVWPVNETH